MESEEPARNALVIEPPIAKRTRSHHENVTPPRRSVLWKLGKNIQKYNTFKDLSAHNQVTVAFLSEMENMKG